MGKTTWIVQAMQKKATVDEAYKYNCEMIVKLARHMARTIKAGINHGDVNLKAQAGGKLAELMHFRNHSIGRIVQLLNECDATQWLDFMACCGGSRRFFAPQFTPSDLLKIISGKSYSEWKDIEAKTCTHPNHPYLT